MARTIVTDSQESINTGVTEIAQDLGAVEAHVEHHAVEIAQHATKLTGLESDITWLKEQTSGIRADLSQAIEAPMEAVRNLTSTVDDLKASLTVKVREETRSSDGNASRPPPETPNRAETRNKGVGSRIRALFHRLA